MRCLVEFLLVGTSVVFFFLLTKREPYERLTKQGTSRFLTCEWFSSETTGDFSQ